VEILSVHDPVFVVDLTPQTMSACRSDFSIAEPASVSANSADTPPLSTVPPTKPIRALALIFAWEQDPVLLSIQPTLDTEMLDTVARLIRTAMLTRRSVASLVTEHGDDHLKRLYFSRCLPRFIYEGIPAPMRHRIPFELQKALGGNGRRKPTALL
jgi:hypothetical protein